MTKKITFLTITVGVVAAMALPTPALASWKHHGTPIQENTNGTITGNARFQSELGGMECQASASGVFLANQTTAELQSYGPHPVDSTTNCKGLGGLAFCQLHDWTPTNLPWTGHTSGNVATITTSSTHGEFTGGFCPIRASLTTPGTVTVTPNQPNTITSGQLSGTLTQHVQTPGGTQDLLTITVSGSGNIAAPNAHTYDL